MKYLDKWRAMGYSQTKINYLKEIKKRSRQVIKRGQFSIDAIRDVVHMETGCRTFDELQGCTEHELRALLDHFYAWEAHL